MKTLSGAKPCVFLDNVPPGVAEVGSLFPRVRASMWDSCRQKVHRTVMRARFALEHAKKTDILGAISEDEVGWTVICTIIYKHIYVFILYYIILYYIVLHYITLSYIILYLYYIILYYIILYYIYIILYYTILYYMISYYIVLYYIILYCIILYYIL